MDAPASLWDNNFRISHTGQRSGGVRPAFLGRLCRLDSAVGNPALRRRPFQTPTADLAAAFCRICDSRSAFTGDHGPARGAHRLPATQHQSTCPQIAGLDVRPCSWQAAAAPRKELHARARTAWRLLGQPGALLAAHDAPVVRASRPAPGPRTPIATAEKPRYGLLLRRRRAGALQAAKQQCTSLTSPLPPRR